MRRWRRLRLTYTYDVYVRVCIIVPIEGELVVCVEGGGGGRGVLSILVGTTIYIIMLSLHSYIFNKMKASLPM